MTFWTYTLTSGSLSIDASDYAYLISIQSDSTSGSCTVLGGIPFKGIQPTSVNISAGQGINLAALSTASPLSGVTVTWISGTIDIVIGF